MRPPGRRDRQLGLFDEERPPGERSSRAVGPAPVPPGLAETARALPAAIRLGTSSWSFPGWAGIVYDRAGSEGGLARAGLGAYARHPLLRTVGIDRTYYAPIPASAFAEYAAAVPEDFRFVAKAHEGCTAPRLRGGGREAAPNPRWLDPGYAVEHVVAPFVEGLGAKAGALVFQFPPQGTAIAREPERFADRLRTFLAGFPRGPLYAVELRDRALLTAAVVEGIAAAGGVPCLSLHPRMPAALEQHRLARLDARGPLVVRWMLGGGLGYDQARSRYAPFSRLVDEDPATRNDLAGLCVAHSLSGAPVFVVANNKAEGSAPLTVFRLAERIADRLRSDPA